jgi:CO dehydrogenase maturation factor
MSLRIAVAGKGGVGKTTVASMLARSYAKQGKRVIALDADPASSLPSALGVAKEERDKIVPVSRMLDLIEERTGARPGESYGGMFVLNPKVDDILDNYGIECGPNVRLLVLGTIEAAGGGCFCPESTLLRSLMDHLTLERDDVLILDMEAGLEHLGRASTRRLDIMLVVLEPGMRSVETGMRIAKMANELGIKNIVAVINKFHDDEEERKLRQVANELGFDVMTSLPYDGRLVAMDIDGEVPFDVQLDGPFRLGIELLIERIEKVQN